MNWTEEHIQGIIADLASENLFASRTLLKIADIEFTVKVPTLAISLSGRPRLMINLAFLNQFAQTEKEVQAALLHECLHHILGHTVKYPFMGNPLNVALDAIINAVIHRTYGYAYSNLFKRIYPAEGVPALLRPISHGEPGGYYMDDVHDKVYNGSLAADDLHELLEYLRFHGTDQTNLNGILFMGNHHPEKVAPENQTLLENMIEQLDGVGIWRVSRGRGLSDKLEKEKQALQQYHIRQWKADTLRLLRRCLHKKVSRLSAWHESHVHLPMLSGADRRAMVSWHAGKMLPIAQHRLHRQQERQQATVYLDVSGSMNHILPHFISLLHGLRQHISQPLWAFSNEVTPAVFKEGALEYKSTYGTSISCVFDHMRRHRVEKALILTDGYVEDFPVSALEGLDPGNIRILLDPDGQASILMDKGMEIYRLSRLKQS